VPALHPGPELLQRVRRVRAVPGQDGRRPERRVRKRRAALHLRHGRRLRPNETLLGPRVLRPGLLRAQRDLS
jgi:hypothetical protein